jgi:hypothetical protein
MQENPDLDPSFIIPTMKIRTDMYEAWIRGDEYYDLDRKRIDLT